MSFHPALPSTYSIISINFTPSKNLYKSQGLFNYYMWENISVFLDLIMAQNLKEGRRIAIFFSKEHFH